MNSPSARTADFFVRPDRASLLKVVRVTAASVVSLVVARWCGLPESYWAVITTMIVMQSNLGASWEVSWQRLLGTLLGGLTATALVWSVPSGLLAFAGGLLAMGVICAFLPEQKGAYRFACITLVIVMLPVTTTPVLTVAVHRFLEVSIGIVVGMTVTAAWPEKETAETTGKAPVAGD
jgi:uncharacterized membrane protein YccC